MSVVARQRVMVRKDTRHAVGESATNKLMKFDAALRIFARSASEPRAVK
jgi:hypothetical protein